MKARYLLSDSSFDFETFDLLTLVVENRTSLLNYLRYLHNDFRGSEHYWTIIKDGDSLPLDEIADFIPDLFSLDINSKKNINALYKLLRKTYYESLKCDIEQLKERASSIINEISMDFDLELVVSNDIKADDLFKIMDLRFEDSELSERELFIKYCQTINELRGVSIFFTAFLHTFFSSKDLDIITNEIKYRRIKLFNLESAYPKETLEKEKFIVVDSDLCIVG